MGELNQSEATESLDDPTNASLLSLQQHNTCFFSTNTIALKSEEMAFLKIPDTTFDKS